MRANNFLFIFYDNNPKRMCALSTSGGLRAPRPPCGRARPAPASDGCAALARSADGVWRYMTTATPFALGYTKSVAFFIRCDSRRSTPGGCFPQTPLSETDRVRLSDSGGFAEPFPPPLRTLFWVRRSSLGRAPQGAARPLTRGRARPAPALSHLLWRLRASALTAIMLKQQTLSPLIGNRA